MLSACPSAMDYFLILAPSEIRNLDLVDSKVDAMPLEPPAQQSAIVGRTVSKAKRKLMIFCSNSLAYAPTGFADSYFVLDGFV